MNELPSGPRMHLSATCREGNARVDILRINKGRHHMEPVEQRTLRMRVEGAQRFFLGVNVPENMGSRAGRAHNAGKTHKYSTV
jgi:hypothetical protein